MNPIRTKLAIVITYVLNHVWILFTVLDFCPYMVQEVMNDIDFHKIVICGNYQSLNFIRMMTTVSNI